ncbi:MAG: DUF2085 domain-containing protein [Caldilineaceae bacterium]|nr:DUF2085 domain-containing protein [Caldilineaceae bacterium]
MTYAQPDQRINKFASDLVLWIARHWVAIFTALWGVYWLLPLLAPVFMHLGLTAPARLIYYIYSFFCHQLPDHSYFFFSHSHEAAPSTAELVAGGMPEGLSLLQVRRFIGNPEVGYKAAVCQRDVAIYGAIFLASFSYGLLRRRIRGIHWKLFLLLALPMAIDGGVQLIGLRESNWLLRTITGALFGVGAIWFLYPFIQTSMDEVIRNEQQLNAPHEMKQDLRKPLESSSEI